MVKLGIAQSMHSFVCFLCYLVFTRIWIAFSVKMTDVPYTAFAIKRPIVRKPVIAACFKPPCGAVLLNDGMNLSSQSQDQCSIVDNVSRDKDDESCDRDESMSPVADDEFSLFSMDLPGLIDLVTDDGRKVRHGKRKHRSSPNEDGSSSKSQRIRPNSFVAVRISSPSIRKQIEHVQDRMIQNDVSLKRVMTSLNKLHITLMVLRMDTEIDIERCKESLKESTDLINNELQGLPLQLKFDGLSSFGSRVLYVNLSEGRDTIKSVSDIVRSVFKKNGYRNADKREFKPHLTVAKVSKGRIRAIPSSSYSDIVDMKFGDENVTSIELLSMTEPPDDTGYYHCFDKISFTK